MSDTPSPRSPEAEAEVHDWSAYYDAEGRLYYYNSVTEESSWDPPEKYNPAPPKEENENKETAETKEQQEETVEAVTAAPAPSTEGGWEAYKDDQGREYYYNTETGETQWERPEGMAEGETEVTSDQKQSPSAEAVPMDVEEVEAKEEPVVEEVDPAEAAEQALNEPDAIMEPGCYRNVHEILTKYGGSTGGPKASQALIASFSGQTAICGLLGLWLADLKTASSSSSDAAKKEQNFHTAADEVRGAAQDTVNRIAMERFTKAKGDGLLFKLPPAELAFLDEMIDSPRWRKLLIDLDAANKDSALLSECLKKISERGHHREIQKRKNQSDHFSVYNGILGSEFAVVGDLGISSSSETEAYIGLGQIVEDLRKTCTSTSYSYLYAIELLRSLLKEAKRSDSTDDKPHLQNAIRKWERLSEDLESAMVDPTMSSTTAGSSTLFRKRRVDIALTISELQQRQRRRRRPSPEGDADVDTEHDDDKRLGYLETAVQNLLRRYALGAPLDDRVLAKLLPTDDVDRTSNIVGKLLIAHPLSMKALLGQLFIPSPLRDATRGNCARLVAYATIAADDAVGKEQEDEQDSEESPSEKLTGMLLTGSRMCELLETTMTFEVVSDPEIPSDDSSPGRKLSSLALRSAPIAQGVMMWATDMAKGPEFASSASYPTFAPSMLALARVIGGRHPFTRRAVLDLALTFLKHSNSELSYKVQNALKERCLRLLLFLLVKGEVAAVLSAINDRLRQKGTSEIDASLVRYFIGGLLDVLRPPYSLSLIRGLGPLLSAPRCMDALRSSYFGERNRALLAKLINSFKEVLEKERDGCTKEDSGNVANLVASYCI